MKLNLKPREVRFKDVTVTFKPLEIGAFQEWMDVISRTMGVNSFNQEEAQAAMMKLAANKEYGALAERILTSHCIGVNGLEVEEEGGTRAGTIADLLTGAAGFFALQHLLSAYVTGEMLTEAEVKNSTGR